MKEAIIFISFVLVGLILEALYIKIARKYGVIDKPNARSSHSHVTVRGGGVIFPLSILFFFLFNGVIFPYFLTGLVLIAVLSVIDDIKSLSARIRFLAHVASISLLFVDLSLFETFDILGLLIAYVLSIGVLNAVNFMDGINGITGLYALSFFIPLLFIIQDEGGADIAANPATYTTAALLAFGYFNFRKQAICFAGDVGSISLGFIMIFFLLGLMTGSQQLFPGISSHDSGQLLDWKYLLCLAVYGVDSILTIIHRLWLKENIFQAHRKHLYQYLSNEKKKPHLLVAGVYACTQLFITLWVFKTEVTMLQGAALILLLSLTYILIKVMIIRTVKNQPAV